MRHIVFLFCVLAPLFVASEALAQEDAGTDAEVLESVDMTAACMDACAREYELCVTSATIPTCIANVPECRGLAPRASEVMAAFCDACGRATTGCDAEEAPDERAVAAAGTEPSPDPPATETRPRRRLTPEERERTEAARARSICERQRGIWDAEAFILMPDGTGRLGICRTPEGAELARMIRDEHEARAEEDERLRRMITEEERARISADQRHDDDIAILRTDVEAQNSRIAMMIAHFICAESRADRWSLSRIDPTTRAYLERDSGLVRDGYVECIHLREGMDVDDDRSGDREADSDRAREASTAHPSLFGSGWRPHLRLSLLGWMGFSPLHPTLAQARGSVASLPAGIGADATVAMSVYGGLYLAAGVGLTYDWPDFSPFATSARLWYHGGLYYHLIREISIGLGYLGSDRFRPSMQSVHSFHGAYLDLSFHGRLRIVEGRIQGSEDMDDPALVFTIRGAAGASIRPAAGTDADGLIQFLLGFEI